jgi:hypothetical protein
MEFSKKKSIDLTKQRYKIFNWPKQVIFGALQACQNIKKITLRRKLINHVEIQQSQ